MKSIPLPAMGLSSARGCAAFRPAGVFLRWLCAVSLAVAGGNALSLPGKPRIGHYDFAYAIGGDCAVRPVQVFDDGAGKVYFQLRPGAVMPAVFVGKAPQLLVMQPEGQYFTAHTDANEFSLVLGAAKATVLHGGRMPADAPERRRASAPRVLASADPGLPDGIDFSESATAGTPENEGMPPSAEPFGSDTATSKAFDIAPGDRDIATPLRRWARASGYDLVWETGWTAPVTATTRIHAPTFLDAVRQVVVGLRAQGYPVRVQVFSDRIVRFSATS